MDAEGIDDLLQEARLLAQHALRNGKLPADSHIFDAIEAATQARERGERPAVVALTVEIQKVSKAAGVTVDQLLRRNTTVGRLRQRAEIVVPFLIGLMTLLLTLYLAFESSELHKADLALREYHDLVGERMPEKIYLAWKMYRYEDVLNAKGPPLAQLDGYQKLVDDAKRLYERRAAVGSLLIDATVIRYLPALFQDHGPCWLQSLARVLNNDERPMARDCRVPKPPAGDAPGAVGTDPSVDRETPDPPTLKPEIDKCLKLRQPPVSNPKTPALPSKLDLDDYELGVTCFLRSLQLSNYDVPLDPLIYACRNKVHLLVSWLLPGMYGLLGACVFVMRALLRNTAHRPGSGDARIVDMLSLLLRVSLGGLAGIIIGWFSVPTVLSADSSALNISSIPFGVAFLAGYGIESLFALLDRLSKTIGHPEDKKSSASGDDAKLGG